MSLVCKWQQSDKTRYHSTPLSQLSPSTWSRGARFAKRTWLFWNVPEYCISVYSRDFSVSTFFSFHWGLGMAEGVSRSRLGDIGRALRGKAWHCDMSGCNHCSQTDLPRNQIHLVIKQGKVKVNWHLSLQLRKSPTCNHICVYIDTHAISSIKTLCVWASIWFAKIEVIYVD